MYSTRRPVQSFKSTQTSLATEIYGEYKSSDETSEPEIGLEGRGRGAPVHTSQATGGTTEEIHCRSAPVHTSQATGGTTEEIPCRAAPVHTTQATGGTTEEIPCRAAPVHITQATEGTTEQIPCRAAPVHTTQGTGGTTEEIPCRAAQVHTTQATGGTTEEIHSLSTCSLDGGGRITTLQCPNKTRLTNEIKLQARCNKHVTFITRTSGTRTKTCISRSRKGAWRYNSANWPNCGTTWKWVVSLTARPLYLRREQASRAIAQSVFNDQRHTYLLSRLHAGRYEQLLSYRHAHILFCILFA